MPTVIGKCSSRRSPSLTVRRQSAERIGGEAHGAGTSIRLQRTAQKDAAAATPNVMLARDWCSGLHGVVSGLARAIDAILVAAAREDEEQRPAIGARARKHWGRRPVNESEGFGVQVRGRNERRENWGPPLMPDGRTTWTSREIGMTWSCIGNLWSACIRTPSSRSASTGAVWDPIVRRHDVHVRPVASCRLHRRRRQRRFRRQPYPNLDHRRRATPRYVVHAAVLERMPRPWLVVEYSAHFYETTHAVLEFFHLHLASGDYIVVEDGVVKFLPEPHYRTYQDGPDRAFPHSRRRKGHEIRHGFKQHIFVDLYRAATFPRNFDQSVELSGL